MLTDRKGPGIGIVNGHEIIAAGGFSRRNTEIFDLNTWTWTWGPSPIIATGDMYNVETVQFNGGVLSVGVMSGE